MEYVIDGQRGVAVSAANRGEQALLIKTRDPCRIDV